MPRIRLGDKCWVQLKKKHYGVFVGFNQYGEPEFVHNIKDGGVVRTSRKGFAGRRQIHIEQRAPRGYERQVVQRALGLVGCEYDMLTFNCEHMANLAVNGQATSAQVQKGFILGLVGTVLGALLVNNNGTHLDANGYRRNKKGQFASRRWW